MLATGGASPRLAMLALLLAGCADNAILELAVEVPEASCAAAVALEARLPEPGAGCAFDQEWLDGDRAALALGATHAVSLVARGAEIDRPLCLRIRACVREDECPPLEVTRGARTEIEIERPFYRGHYTALALGPIDPCADASARVSRCEVEGCAGGAPRETWCEGDRHLCEP